MIERKEMIKFDTVLLMKYGLYVKLIYDHELYCDKSEWDFTHKLMSEFKFSRKHFYNVLYLVASHNQEIYQEIRPEHIIEESAKKKHNKILALKKKVEKIMKAKPPGYFFLSREIQKVSFTMNGRKIETDLYLFKNEIEKILEKQILNYTGETKRKTLSERTKAIQLMKGFANFLEKEKIISTKEKIYSFIERMLTFCGYDFSDDKDPRSTIKNGLR